LNTISLLPALVLENVDLAGAFTILSKDIGADAVKASSNKAEHCLVALENVGTDLAG
jgi:hypothetical protein